MIYARLALYALLVGAAAPMAQAEPAARGRAAHVVLIVWDGMRADFATEKHAPNLWALAQSGVTFRKHHSIYPTLTTVNAAALATGVFPSRSGPVGNYEYSRRPTKDNLPRLALPTIVELVQARGGTTAVAGTKSAPLLFDRTSEERSGKCSTIVAGKALPTSAQADVEKKLGPYPTSEDLPCTAQDRWTTRALTEVLWQDGVPEFSVLWMGDPDRTEHAEAPGSEKALAAIKSADANLATVLQALTEKGVRDSTDILVASDHGFSTIARPLNLAGLLTADGFPIVAVDQKEEKPGAIRVVGNGGSIFFYLAENDAEMSARLVRWLQTRDFTGVIFSRAPVAGTFPLARVHLEKPEGPDVIMAFRWSEGRNAHQTAGMIEANGKGDAKGTHGTLSPFDVHNLLLAAGPDFRVGKQSDLPSSNLDVAASIMHLLGLKTEHSLDGRVLEEAWRETAATASTTTEEATTGKWRQYLRISKVGATEYIDEGNGGAIAD